MRKQEYIYVQTGVCTRNKVQAVNTSSDLCQTDTTTFGVSGTTKIITETKTAPLSFSIKILGLFFQDFPKLKTDLKGLLLDSKRTFPKGVYPTIRTVFKD